MAPDTTRDGTTLWRFRAASFSGAFLLFLLEPLVAKQLLPWFGGSPAVWSVCLVFFQTTLLLGYVYAHLSARLGVIRQTRSHLVLFVGAAFTLPVIVSTTWKPGGTDSALWCLLGALSVTVGAPYVILASTAPLLQDWFRKVKPGQSPYALYVLSNAGSLVALLSYPAVLERVATGRSLAIAWSIGFVTFGALTWTCARAASLAARDAVRTAHPPDPSSVEAVRAIDRVLWCALSACGTGLLLGATNQLCQDVAVVPLLWVVPLAIFLTTFIAAFARRYSRTLCAAIFVVAVAALIYSLGHAQSVSVWLQGGAILAVLAAGCMLCHGELARLAPHERRLTAFYTWMALGGSAGGLFVGLAASRIFDTYLEFPLMVVSVPLLLMLVAARHATQHRPIRGLALVASLPVVVVLAAFGFVARAGHPAHVVATTRNFFGVLTVVDDDADSSGHHVRRMLNGRVLHGAERLDGPRPARPTTYYAPGSGIDDAIRLDAGRLADRPIRVGVVGLGAGTIAAWGRPGDEFRFFEINPQDADYASRYFSFLRESPARISVVLGDGRLSLERESTAHDAPYDVLALDAFSGDSIPVHLLTLEAFDVYWTRLAADGVLAVHVSNRMVDLEPVVQAAVDSSRVSVSRVRGHADAASGAADSVWLLLSRDAEFASRLGSLADSPAGARRVHAWTDDFSSIADVLR